MIVRPSGTEPKVKFYFGLVGKDLKDAEAKAEAFAKAVLEMIDSITA